MIASERVNNGYTNSQQHLADELLKLDIMLHLQILLFRSQTQTKNNEPLSDLYISDETIDTIIHPQPPNPMPNPNEIQKKLDSLRLHIHSSVKKSLENGVWLPLFRLAQGFQLTNDEINILLICLAPELDQKYEKLYAYLQEDITCKSPSINLIFNLICQNQTERMEARGYFLPDAPLCKHGLISFIDPTSERPFPSRQLEIDDRVVNFLTGHYGADFFPDLSSIISVIRPLREWNTIANSESLKNKLNRLAEKFFQERQGSLVYYFYGPQGSGKKSVAEAFCHEHELLLYIIDTPALLALEKAGNPFDLLKRLAREPFFFPAVVYLDHFQAMLSHTPLNDLFRRAFSRVIEEYSIILILSGEKPWDVSLSFQPRWFQDFLFTVPGYSERKLIWESEFGQLGQFWSLPEKIIDRVASQFRFTPGQIHAAAATAVNQVLMGGNKGPDLDLDTLTNACRHQCHTKLGDMARKIEPRYSWSDIVLPTDQMKHLKEMIDFVQFRQVVFDQWGFEYKLSLGKGLNILFYGPSGTGKSMGAEIIAHELGLDFYKIDLSGVVSKYIGETEKNLATIFKEAETANAVLFFDEADALFGKRSEVKDAHDRYANIETNYLLQKMEEHEGIVILATNFRKNIDDAFTRRIHFCLDFPFPDERYRRMIWEKSFPMETPRQEDIDFEFLGRRFKVAGGAIKNIVLGAAFLAAARSESVGMKHIIHALQREYQKLGLMIGAGELGKYQELRLEGSEGGKDE